MTVTTVLNTARLEQLIKQLPTKARGAVDTTAGEIRNTASSLARRDTGAMAASIYVSNGDDSDYSQRSGEARSRNPDGEITPEVRPEFVISLFASGTGYMSVVGVAVAYGLFNELGTRFMSAAPFMIPATEGASSDFVAQMSKIADL